MREAQKSIKLGCSEQSFGLYREWIQVKSIYLSDSNLLQALRLAPASSQLQEEGG